jgi:hypothetical protein
MKNIGKYESTLEATIKSFGREGDADEAAFMELREAAYKIDQLREDLAYCAERLAKSCSSFAAHVRDGGSHMTPPTSSSLISDIAEKTAVLNEKTSAFPLLLRLVLGPSAPKEFFGILRGESKIS